MDFAKNIILISCILSAAVLAAVSATFLQTPDNVAVVRGEEVVLNCKNDNPDFIDAFRWEMETNTRTITPASCKNASSALDGYAVELQPGNPVCNLIILKANASQSGRYRCFNPGEINESAESQVIVLESDPQCNTQPSSLVNVSDKVLMSCSVSCYGNTDTGPVMTWYDSAGLEVSASNIGSDLSPNYVTEVTPNIPTVDSYACVTNFTKVPQSIGSNPANNVPSYTYNCTTLELTVQYAPFSENITITPDTSNDFYIGQTLNCSATTVPSVSGYNWMNGSEVIISDSSVLTLDQIGENLNYTCTAWNELGSNKTTIIITVVSVPEITTPNPGEVSGLTRSSSISYTTTSSDNLSPGSDNIGVIVGAVMGVLLAAMLIALIVCCFVKSCCLYRKFRHDTPGKYKDPNSSSNSSDEFSTSSDRNKNRSQEPIFDHQLIGLGLVNAAVEAREELHVLHVEPQFDPTLAHRRFTHTGSHIPHYDEHYNLIRANNEEKISFSFPKSA